MANANLRPEASRLLADIHEIARMETNVLFWGPPGSGKTLLATRLRKLRTNLTGQKLWETFNIWRGSGLCPTNKLAVPFRAPHHTVSLAGMVGSISRAAVRPPAPPTAWPIRYGELSLAHGGILLLDEIDEFTRPVLEAVRMALLRGSVFLPLPKARRADTFEAYAGSGITAPAEFQLVATTNDLDRLKKYVSLELRDRFSVVLDIKPDSKADLKAGRGIIQQVIAEIDLSL